MKKNKKVLMDGDSSRHYKSRATKHRNVKNRRSRTKNSLKDGQFYSSDLDDFEKFRNR